MAVTEWRRGDDAIDESQLDRFDEGEKLEYGQRPQTTVQSGASTHLNADSPITYLDLTFDSPLPTPPSTSSSLPQPPKLSAYTSPYTWSTRRKTPLLVLSCVSTLLTAYTAGTYSPPSRLMAREFNTSNLIINVGITTFCIGFSLTPMALAPVSEIFGRYPIFCASGVVLALFQAVCSVVTNLEGMLIGRVFVGAGASCFSSVAGGVIADLYHKEERNTAMALFSGCVLFGTGAGPLVSAAIVDNISNGTIAWKWTFWHQVISNGLLLLGILLFFRETRGSVLLKRKAAKLNKWYEQLEAQGVYGLSLSSDMDSSLLRPVTSESSTSSQDFTIPRRIRWTVEASASHASLASMIATSCMRPFYMLFTEPVVFSFSLWAAFAWGVLYLGFAVVPYLHLGDFDAMCRTYLAMMGGAIVATATSIWQERLLKHPKWTGAEATDSKFWGLMKRRFPADAPESRLYFSCITALLLPAGLFGAFLTPATSSPDDKGTPLAIGIGFATWGIYTIYLASFNYFADMYHIYASSALAANSFCRNMLGGSFPVITGLMFDGLGIKQAGGMLGAIALALGVIPWVLVFWGAKIRAKSKMAMVSILLSLPLLSVSANYVTRPYKSSSVEFQTDRPDTIPVEIPIRCSQAIHSSKPSCPPYCPCCCHRP